MISRVNLTLREMMPKLVGNTVDPDYPNLEGLRPALVRHNTETTYVVPGDWPAVDGTGWFVERRVDTNGGDIEYLIDGSQTMEAMVEAIRTAEKPSHFVVLLGWSLDVHTAMPTAGGKTISFINLIEERAALGAVVRVLLWDNALCYAWRDEDGNGMANASTRRLLNDVSKSALDRLRTQKKHDVACVLDDNTKGWVSQAVAGLAGKPNVHSIGAHHQKILLVYGSEGLVAFCGGVDIDPNRLPSVNGGGLHDAHVRVTGTTAKELWEIAQARWSESSDDGNAPVPATIAPLAPPIFATKRAAPYLTKAVQTVGNPGLAKTTDHTLWPAVKYAIRSASKFIYMEDQFFWSLDLVDELVEASKRLQHITILVPAWNVGEQPYKRFAAIRELVKRGGPTISQKVGIFESIANGHNYVHSKLFVVDDEFAIVGSANANNRGYFFDSEASVCISERAAANARGLRRGEWFAIEGNFARRFRMDLWAEHLKLDVEELADGVGAVAHWRALMNDLERKTAPTANAQVRPYTMINAGKQRRHGTLAERQAQWEEKPLLLKIAEREMEKPKIFTKNEAENRTGIDPRDVEWDDAADVKPWWDVPFSDSWAPEIGPETMVGDPRE
ncbi:MAG: hypothetical protein IPK82_43975 [Polyangiaceae bacterium]|nr:hypothetical protein [Polyangiaceae bacterium]